MDPAVTGALIGAGGAGFIALATQWLGNRRESATRAHALRIEHDADARAALDEALATAYDIRAAIATYGQAVVLVADSRAIDSDVIPDSLFNDATQKMAAVDDQIVRMRYSLSRLTIRFGSGHEVTATYASILLASHDLRDTAHEILFKGYHDELTAETACALPYALDRLVSELSERAHAWASRS